MAKSTLKLVYSAKELSVSILEEAVANKPSLRSSTALLQFEQPKFYLITPSINSLYSYIEPKAYLIGTSSLPTCSFRRIGYIFAF